jgi:hypothetical protein
MGEVRIKLPSALSGAVPSAYPRTGRTLSSVMEALDDEGFTEHFAVRGDRLVGFETGTLFAAEDVLIRGVERFEGISDPDDMSVLYAIESHSGIRGTLTDAFGVYSNPVVSDFMNKVESELKSRRSLN